MKERLKLYEKIQGLEVIEKDILYIISKSTNIRCYGDCLDETKKLLTQIESLEAQALKLIQEAKSSEESEWKETLKNIIEDSMEDD